MPELHATKAFPSDASLVTYIGAADMISSLTRTRAHAVDHLGSPLITRYSGIRMDSGRYIGHRRWVWPRGRHLI